jgi:NDP-sugar pyrophosphorylase family protein
MMSEEYLTHEEMLEIASQREAINAQKREIKKQFDAWFEEMEGYSFRHERFWDDFDYAKDKNDYNSMKLMVKWLRTAFEMGYNASESKNYSGTE